jgi:beta-propeller repeat-containing protein/centrosomal CEP192-like protein
MGGILRGRILALLLLSSTLVLAVGSLALRSDYSQRHALQPQSLSRLSGKPSSTTSAQLFDPVLAYATYLDGSNGISNASAFFVDANGNSYVGGSTQANNFPTTTGVINPSDPEPTGYPAIGFVSKFTPDGQSLVFSTFVQGLSEVDAIALDSAGNIYLAGPTGVCNSCNPAPIQFPNGTTPFDPSPKAIGILKLNSTATSIVAATYLGGSGVDTFAGIAVDSDGSVYVTGVTNSNDFPLLNPMTTSFGTNGKSAFVTKLNSTLSALAYSTFIPDYAMVTANAIAVDSLKNAYVAGTAYSGAVVKLNPAGSSILYQANPSQIGSVNTIALDAQQNAWIGGMIGGGVVGQPPLSANIGTCLIMENCAVAARLDNSGAVSFIACLGVLFGPQPGVTALSLDASGNVYAAGGAYSSALIQNPIETHQPAGNVFVSAFQPSPPNLLFSSWIDGLTVPTGPPQTTPGIGADSSGNIYVAGTASVLNNSVLNALQPTPGSVPCVSTTCQPTSAFLLKISPTDAPATAVDPGIVAFQQAGDTTAVQSGVAITDLGSSPLTISNVTVTGDGFSLVANDCTTVAAAGGGCGLNLQYSPTSTSNGTGTLVITDNSAGSPHTIQLVSVPGQDTVQLSPSTLNFGDQTIGGVSASQRVVLTNTANSPLQSIRIQASSQFNETNSCTTSLSANAFCYIDVTFAPTTAATTTGTISITDNAFGSPQTVALTGTGQTSTSPPGTPPSTPPGIGLGAAPGGATSVTVAGGASASYSLSIGGAGMSGSATLSCSGAPSGAVCTVPASVSLSATTPSTFNVGITTTSRSNLWFFPIGSTLLIIALMVAAYLAAATTAPDHVVSRLRWRLVPAFAIVLCACGGGGSPSTSTPPLNASGTPAGTYTIVITAKSGTTTQTQNLTLVVQ